MPRFFRSSNKGTRTVVLQINSYEVEVSFKPIKNMYLKISAKDSRIRVSAPVQATEREVVQFVQSRDEWIKIRLKKFSSRKAVPQLKYETGDQVPLWGEMLPLKVISGGSSTKAYLHINTLMLNVRGKNTFEKREKAIQDFYRRELKAMISELVKEYEPKMKVKVSEIGVKNMKTRWGTCNVRAHRIWLNLKLAEFDLRALEMVVVHEMVHLLERGHNKRFYGFMDRFMPEWKSASKLLDGTVC